MAEQATYAIPAAIDYILDASPNYSQLFYIGHSMGATLFFNAMIIDPSYNDKIRLMFGLGPVAYLGNGTGIFMDLLGDFAPDFTVWLKINCKKPIHYMFILC